MDINIGQNIRKIRELKGYSQEFLASELEISQRQLSRIENNESDISVSKLENISKILEVSLNQILGFDERFIFQHCENAYGANHQNNYAFSEKEREQYEKRISHLEEEITYLREQLNSIISK